MFTARYGLSTYTEGIRFSFKGLTAKLNLSIVVPNFTSFLPHILLSGWSRWYTKVLFYALVVFVMKWA